MTAETDRLLDEAARWLWHLDEPTFAQIKHWLDRYAEVTKARERTPCPWCPHWMELHDDDGSCGCGASHPPIGAV